MSPRFLHLHGFASNAQSVKGQRLAEAFAEHGVSLETPDLNRPSFSRLTYGACLQFLDETLEGDAPVVLSGSSFGGYLAARWAELHPDRVQRLLLSCPAFDLVGRWTRILGEPAMAQWEREGTLVFPDRDGNPTPVHWGLVEDARRHPTHPEVRCPTVIIHGTQDEIVPIASSRDYAASHDHVRLVEVDDVHTLENSIDVVIRVALAHLLDDAPTG